MQHNLPKLFPLFNSVLPASFKAFSHKREISLFPSTVKCFSNGCVSRIGKPTSICKFISNERGKPSKASKDSVEWCDDCDVSRWWLEMMMMMMMMVFPGNQLEVNVFPGQLPFPLGPSYHQRLPYFELVPIHVGGWRQRHLRPSWWRSACRRCNVAPADSDTSPDTSHLPRCRFDLGTKVYIHIDDIGNDIQFIQ